MDRQSDAGLLDALGPVRDGAGVEGELGDDRHVGIGSRGKILLPGERLVDLVRRAVPVYVAVSLRMARDMEAGKSVSIEEAGLHHLDRAVEAARRLLLPAAQKQGLLNVRLVAIALDPVLQRCRIRNAAGGEVRHDREALGTQTARGRDHVLDGGAGNVGDIDARSGRQERPEVVDLGCGARHDLDRPAVEDVPQTRR